MGKQEAPLTDKELNAMLSVLTMNNDIVELCVKRGVTPCDLRRVFWLTSELASALHMLANGLSQRSIHADDLDMQFTRVQGLLAQTGRELK